MKSLRLIQHVLAVLLTLVVPVASQAQPAATNPAANSTDLERWLDHAQRLLPADAKGYSSFQSEQLSAAATAIDQWGNLVSRIDGRATPETNLRIVERLLAAKEQVDRWLDDVLKLRAQFPMLEAADQRPAALRNYLRTMATLIDLSGRLRYLLSDTIDSAAFEFASRPEWRERLIDLLATRKSAIGADIMSLALFDPPANAANRAQPATAALKAKLLKLIALTGQHDVLPRLASYVRDAKTPPALVIQTAETIRQVGLPQDERPGQDATLPKPPITAAQLHDVLSKLPEAQLAGDLRSRREELVGWLAERKEKGLKDDVLRLGRFDVQPGDWLLMRNPSPYNLFTDLSPGLFTHVGVVAMELGPDGRRRMVLVDLPEQGKKMDAANVEAYVQRSLHYFFVRHPSTAAAQKMGEMATALIGQPTEFDLNFRTDRVQELKGQSLEGKTVRTYCAGLLLLCAQETSASREEFFPLPEAVRGGRTAENLAKLGISIGQDFISPTGTLFSPKLQIVGRREPMYDPRREVEEAVFDHFALSLEKKPLSVSTDLSQTLLVKMAEVAKQNPLLSRALAQAAGVGSDIDLVAVAAAAVVQTLDDVAYSHSGDMEMALAALALNVPVERLASQGVQPAQIERIKQLRGRHTDLVQQMAQNRLTPRQLREALLKYYIERGKAQLDRRFFTSAK